MSTDGALPKRSVSDRARWYVDRVRAMSVRELAFRAVQLGRRAGEALAYGIGGGSNLPALLGEGAAGRVEAMTSGARPFLPLLEEPVAGDPPPAARETIAEAERIMRGTWTLFGREIRLEESVDWHVDPLLARRWPRRFYARVDHRGGGAKYVWELARHQFVGTLARAYSWTGDRRFADRAVSLVRSWIDQNPRYEGVHWSPFECALRLLSWSLIFHATRRSGAWSSDALASFLGSLGDQARFVASHPSRFSSANNHLVAEAAGLACVGLAFPEFREADRWRTTGVAVLERELQRQIRPDGTGAEQAPYYLACVLDHALFVDAVGGCRGQRLSVAARERVAAGARFLERLGGRDGRPFAIGDADDGRAVPLDASAVDIYQATRIGAAVALDRLELARGDDPVLERVYWLCGRSATERRAGPRLAPPPSSEVFADGGTVIVAAPDGRSRVVFDQGPLGYLSIAAHGHSDALSVLLEWRGEPLLIDCGTYVYHEAPVWRGYFRGTRAHNTVMVGGLDQSEGLGDTLWGRQARVVPEFTSVGGVVQLVLARHDGYSRLEPPVVHRRALLDVAGDYWLIVDWLEGTSIPAAEVLWHLHRAVRPVPAGPLRWSLDGPGGGPLDLVMAATTGMDSRVASGEEAPPLGWASNAYGERHAIATITTAAPAGGPWVAATVIGPGITELSVLERSGAAHIEVRRGTGRDAVVIAPGGRGPPSASELACDGLAAVVRGSEAGGQPNGLAVFQARSVGLRGQVLWRSSGSTAESAASGVFARNG